MQEIFASRGRVFPCSQELRSRFRISRLLEAGQEGRAIGLGVYGGRKGYRDNGEENGNY